MITAERLREVVTYDPETGIFRWTSAASSTKVRAGDVAGYVCSTLGYVMMGVDGASYRAHRLAWLSFYGAWPVGQIDHINGNKIDNRMANLRDVPASINRQNQHNPMRGNSIGILGVRRSGMKFETSICVEGKGVWLGTFESAEEAQSEYFKAKRIYHPGFTG